MSPSAVYEVVHLLLLDYIPFIVLLTALFTVTGGIHIKGNLHGSPSIEHGPAGDRHGAGGLDGHDRGVDAADPAHDPR